MTGAAWKGVRFAYFRFPGDPANLVALRVVDSVTNRYRSTLGKGRISTIGEFTHTRSFAEMSFAPRDIA